VAEAFGQLAFTEGLSDATAYSPSKLEHKFPYWSKRLNAKLTDSPATGFGGSTLSNFTVFGQPVMKEIADAGEALIAPESLTLIVAASIGALEITRKIARPLLIVTTPPLVSDAPEFCG
jgi:hypothetical protein